MAPIPEVRILTLWQPWAQLMADGRKTAETRSWSTSYRGWIAIHAAKAFPKEAQRKAIDFGYTELKFGVIVAFVQLDDVVPTELAVHRVSSGEIVYGNYDPGRFAWLTSRCRPLTEPLDYKGGQGLRRLPELVASEVLSRGPVHLSFDIRSDYA